MVLEDYLGEFTTASVDLWAIVIAVILSAVLGLILSEVYKRFGHSLSNRAKFAMLLPPIAMTTALIISIVKSSLALSLGLVGALSIIRFRTAIKEPEELAYLFLTISIGLGMGASLYFLTAIGFVLIAGVIVFISYGPKNELGINLVIKSKKINIDEIVEVLNKIGCNYTLRRTDQDSVDNEYAFFIDAIGTNKLNIMSKEIKKIDSNVQISYYEAQVGI